jgi:hypothetical protein
VEENLKCLASCRLIAVSVVSGVFTGLLGFHRQDEGFVGITRLSGVHDRQWNGILQPGNVNAVTWSGMSAREIAEVQLAAL